MGISTFGGSQSASGSTSTAGKIVGELVSVPVNFSTPGYIDSGSTFDPVQYPQLATVMPPQFNGDLWQKITAPAIPTSGNTTTLGLFINAFSYGGEFFVVFAKGHIFRTTGGNISSLAFFKQIPLAPGTTSISWAGSAGPNIYVSFVSSTTLYVYSDITLATPNILTAPVSQIGIVRYANGIYFASTTTGVGATIYKSTDGLTFTSVALGTTATYVVKGIDYNGSTWLVTTTGTSTLNHATSTDGTTWTARSGPTVGSNGMRWNGTYFVTIPVTSGTAISTSPDGITWTTRTGAISSSPTYIDLLSNNALVVGSATASTQQYSADGITWVSKAALFPAGPMSVTSAMRAFGTTIFAVGCLIGGNSQWSFATSTDQLTTLSTSSPVYFASGAPTIFAPVTVGSTTFTMDYSLSLNTVGGLYSAVSSNGGVAWSTPTQLPVIAANWKGLITTPTKFILWGWTLNTVGAATGSVVCSSSDGINWTVKTYATTTFAFLQAQGESLYGYLSASTSVYVSSDYGNSFVIRTLPGTTGTQTFPYVINNTVALVAPVGSCYYSVDGWLTNGTATYTSLSSATPSVAAVGPKGTIVMMNLSSNLVYFFTADNGVSWVSRNFPVAYGNIIRGAAYANGYYYVFCSGGSYYYSSDALNWISSSVGSTADVMQNWSNFSVSNGVPLAGGIANSGFLAGDTTTYRVPYIAPVAFGSKWTIKAE